MSGIEDLVENMTVVPVTGEVVDLRNPTEVALAIDAIDQISRQAREAKRILAGALHAWAVDRGETTFQVPNAGTWVRESPSKTYTDPAKLKAELLAAGMPADRVAEIIVETIDRKVDGTQAQKAARANAKYREIIDAHTVTVEKTNVRRKT